VIPIGAKPHYTEIRKIRRFSVTIYATKHPEFIDITEKAWRNPSYLRLPRIPVKPPVFRCIAATTVILLAIGSAVPAFAQYVWFNEKGVKQYSDMPPPPSIPAGRILKQPSDNAPSSANSEASAPAQAEPAATTKPPMTTAERNADFRKRHAEQAEKEKKAAEQARAAAEKKKNCQRAREYQNALASGGRMTHTDQNGERSFLTDDQRAQEMQDVNRVLQQCK
jgi:type IV secretory pathway VirB10-like protein